MGQRAWQRRLGLAGVIGLSVLASCGGKVDELNTPSSCEPGQVVACECPGGPDGTRECLTDGSGFGPCDCAGATGGSGGNSTGGTGGVSTGGTGGASTGGTGTGGSPTGGTGGASTGGTGGSTGCDDPDPTVDVDGDGWSRPRAVIATNAART